MIPAFGIRNAWVHERRMPGQPLLSKAVGYPSVRILHHCPRCVKGKYYSDLEDTYRTDSGAWWYLGGIGHNMQGVKTYVNRWCYLSSSSVDLRQ